MPKDGLNIYFSIRDGASPTLSAIADKTRALDKETQQLEQSYQALQKANASLIQRQTALRKELSLAKDEAKDAKRAFEDLGDAASQDAYEKAQQKVEALRNEISATSKALRENEKIFKSNMETVRKGATGSGTGGNDGGFAMLAKGIASGQIGQMFSSSLGGAAETLLTSAVGTPTASLISDTVSSAITGAAAGAMFGLPGILIGGGVGALSGLISGGTKIYEAQDDAFKEYVQEGVEGALEDQQTRTETGSTIAGSREQTQMAFAQRLGSEEAAAEYLGRVQDMAARTNYTYDEITGYSKLLLNSYNPDEVFSVLQSLSDATAGLNLSSSDVEQMIAGLSRMRTTGKATQEYLNFFSERGVDVYDALGQSLGVDKSQVANMVTSGEIGGVEAAQAILEYIDQEFGGLSEKLMGTYDAMVDNLSDAEANLQARAGEGYNETRKEGIQAQQEWMEQKAGELGDAYSMIGQWQASLENLAEQYERDALDAVMSGTTSDLYADSDQLGRLEELAEEYQAALAEYEAGNQEAGARMGQLLAEAQIIAQNEYNASEGAQLALQSQLDLAGRIREDAASNEAYWNAGYQKGQEFSKGMAAAWTSLGLGADDDGGYMSAGEAMQLYEQIRTGGRSYAVGLDRVPYDDFPALLHQGERVLTANEARAMDQGGSGGITIQIGELAVREEADVDRVAETLMAKLRLARMVV